MPTRGRRCPPSPQPRGSHRLVPERVCGGFRPVTAFPTEPEMRFLFFFFLISLIGSFADIVENSENTGESAQGRKCSFTQNPITQK